MKRIEIKTKKVISPGVTEGKARQIVSVEVLPLWELPVEYQESAPFCCKFCEGGLVMQLENYRAEYLNPGDILAENHFQEIISWVRVCAKKLRKINKINKINSLRKKLEEEWQGEEIMII